MNMTASVIYISTAGNITARTLTVQDVLISGSRVARNLCDLSSLPIMWLCSTSPAPLIRRAHDGKQQHAHADPGRNTVGGSATRSAPSVDGRRRDSRWCRARHALSVFRQQRSAARRDLAPHRERDEG